MSAAVDNVQSMAKRSGRQKTFIAERDIFDLLAAAIDLLKHARKGDYTEARLIRNAIRTSVAESVEREADELLVQRLAELTGREHASEVKRIRAEVEARRAILRMAASEAMAAVEGVE